MAPKSVDNESSRGRLVEKPRLVDFSTGRGSFRAYVSLPGARPASISSRYPGERQGERLYHDFLLGKVLAKCHAIRSLYAGARRLPPGNGYARLVLAEMLRRRIRILTAALSWGNSVSQDAHTLEKAHGFHVLRDTRGSWENSPCWPCAAGIADLWLPAECIKGTPDL